jgi:hypothetical protein
MDLRRLVLVMALGLFAITILASLSVPTEDRSADAPPRAAQPAAPPPKTIAFTAPGPAKPRVKRVAAGAHVIVRVESEVAGQAQIEALGLVQPVEPGSPASFDVLASRPGRYEVALLPVEGRRAVLGTLVVR